MVLTLDLAPDVAQRLQVTAERQGVGIADVVSRLVDTLPDEPVQATASPQQRAAAFLAWANRDRPFAPPLSDEAVSRASIYEGRP